MTYTVYKITNKTTGKTYVGCTSDYAERFRNHFTALRNNKHKIGLMQLDYNTGHRFEHSVIASGISCKKEALALEAENVSANSYNRNKLFLVNGYPDGAIRQDVLSRIDLSESTKERLAHLTKRSVNTITKMVRSNHIKLALRSSLKVIREQLGLTNSQILNEGYNPITRLRRKNRIRKVWLVPVSEQLKTKTAA